MKAMIASLVVLFAFASADAGPPSSGGSSAGSRPSTSPPSRPSFSGGSNSGSSGSKPPSVSKPAFSSGGSGGSSSSPSVGKKPVTSSSFDSSAISTQAKSESRASIKKADTPKAEYKTASGQTKPIDPKKAEGLRNSVDAEKFTTRAQRSQTTYHVYHDRPPMAYHDPYGPLFMYMLLDRSLDDRAAWAYHHKESMDPARYEELVKRDAALEAKIRKLEADKVAKNPDHTLPGVDPDLQYSDEYVDSVLNFEEDEQPEETSYRWLWVTIGFLLVIGLLFMVSVARNK